MPMASNPGRLVYGAIAVGALLSAESARNETYAETVGAVLIALMLYWLAHSYAVTTGRRLGSDQAHTLAVFAESMREEADILLGAALPLLAVLVSWAAGATLTSGVSAGIWTSVGVLVAAETLAAVRTKRTGLDLVVQSAIGLLLGLLVIAIRVVLHH
jgi:hypothetical protein